MSEGFSLGERLRITAANDDWQPQLHQLAERLAGLSAEQRGSVWADEMSRFIQLQRQSGVGSETIGRRVTSMAKIVGDLVVCLEANQADAGRRDDNGIGITQRLRTSV